MRSALYGDSIAVQFGYTHRLLQINGKEFDVPISAGFPDFETLEGQAFNAELRELRRAIESGETKPDIITRTARAETVIPDGGYLVAEVQGARPGTEYLVLRAERADPTGRP